MSVRRKAYFLFVGGMTVFVIVATIVGYTHPELWQ